MASNKNFEQGNQERKTMRSIVRASKRGFTLIELMIVVAIVGILAVLAIYGVRKYLANAKTAEARNSLGQMGKDQSTEFEMESMPGTVLTVQNSAASSHGLCVSPANPVPANMTAVQGKKYQSDSASNADWQAQGTLPRTGWPCLKFSMDAPQYYQYNFTSDATTTTMGQTWSGQAQGDLNGDGTVFSLFTLAGAVNATNAFNLAPNIVETNPEE
jgi:type IV pilus assembly protein PilA